MRPTGATRILREISAAWYGGAIGMIGDLNTGLTPRTVRNVVEQLQSGVAEAVAGE